jgi:hypothetical protein
MYCARRMRQSPTGSCFSKARFAHNRPPPPRHERGRPGSINAGSRVFYGGRYAPRQLSTSMLGTCLRTREYSGTMASTIGLRPWSRTDSTGHSTRVVDRGGTARRQEGWSQARGRSDIGRSDSDALELETSPRAAEAANPRLYLPAEYDRVQGRKPLKALPILP